MSKPQKLEEGLFTLGTLEARVVEWIRTGVDGFDKLLGGGLPGAGGLVRNSLMMYAGRKGAGKSTFWTQVAAALTAAGFKVLYISGEEDLSQFAYRAINRLGMKPNPRLLVTDRKDIEFVIDMAMKHKVDVIIADSLPMLFHADTGAKVRVSELDTVKKTLNCAIVFVQHETKSNHIAGSAMDMHMCDIILKADPEWDQPSIRRLRVEKNRFAPVLHEMRYRLEQEGVVMENLISADPFYDAAKKAKAGKAKRNKNEEEGDLEVNA